MSDKTVLRTNYVEDDNDHPGIHNETNRQTNWLTGRLVGALGLVTRAQAAAERAESIADIDTTDAAMTVVASDPESAFASAQAASYGLGRRPNSVTMGPGVTMPDLTTGALLIAYGDAALGKVTSGANSSSFGHESLANMTTGFANSAFAHSALKSVTTGHHLSAFALQALANNIDGDGHTAGGVQALLELIHGKGDTAWGVNAGRRAQGDENTLTGYQAGYSNGPGAKDHSYSTVTGAYAGFDLDTGDGNSLTGHSAGRALRDGEHNTMTGRAAGEVNVVGDENVFTGYRAGASALGSRNTFDGALAGASSPADLDEAVLVGYDAQSFAADPTVVGARARVNQFANGGTALGAGAIVSGSHAHAVALGDGTVSTAPWSVCVGPRDIEVTDGAKGLMLRTAGGQRFRVKCDEAGALFTQAV